MSIRRAPARLAVSLGAVVLLGGTLAGCGASTITADELESAAADSLAEANPDLPTPDVSCPEDLDAEVGATIECTLTVEGDDLEQPVRIEITAIDGDRFEADVQPLDEE